MKRHAFTVAALACLGLVAACTAQRPMQPDDAAASRDPREPSSIQSRTDLPAGRRGPTAQASRATPTAGDAGAAFQPAACTACHGERGEGQASGAPVLAGQGRLYLARQLQDYRSGARTNPIMQPVADTLSDADIDAAAAWYSGLPAARTPVAQQPAQGAPGREAHGIEVAGARLAQVGDVRRQIAACDNCHGPQGRGLAPAVPRLAGQQEDYLRAQLVAWRQGTRRNDDAGAMAAVARELDDRDVAAVVRWYAGRPVPVPRMRPE